MREWIRALTLVLSLPLIYFAAGFVGAVIPGSRADLPAGTEYLIGLARGPIHYDIMLPMTPEVRAHFGFAEAQGVPVQNPLVEWLLVGWGSKRFYTSVGTYSDISGTALLYAVTGDGSVMHLNVAGDVSGVAGIRYLTLSEAQFGALVRAIDKSFYRDDEGALRPLPNRLGPFDAFYLARGHFEMFHTCNDWIGKTLRAAGVKMGAWTPTPQSVDFSLDWFAPKPN